jgi:uncharacterized membrane protein YphA (DoxX/SURF4 family)
MTSTGVVQLIGMDEEVKMITGLGYPAYLVTMLGVCKILGVVAVLVPRFPLLKEWAYAGFFFNMSGAIFSHVFHGSAATELFGPTLLLVLTAVSWYLRPADRKMVLTNQEA